MKPANYRENRRDRRLSRNQTGKRQVVVIVREREGRTLPAVFKSESAALGWIATKVAKGTRLMADEAASWNDLHSRYEMDRIDHGSAYSLAGGVYTNGAKSFSAACGAVKSATTTTWQATTLSATRRRARGARIIAG